MKKTIFILAISLSFSAPALADTDYICLNKCASSGKPAIECLTACSYSQNGGQNSSNAIPNGNRILSPLIPLSKDQRIPQIAQNAKPEKDYACMNECLKAGTTYSWCESKCTK